MSTIPVSLTQEQFEQHIRPGLSVAKRGYECSIPLYKVFNYILYRLHTGCQWEQLPLDNAPDDPTKKKSATLACITTTANGAVMAA
jgi:transposase